MAKILIVDDEPALLRMIASAVLRMGHDVITATSGAEALQILETNRVEVVVTDLMMPDQDGMSLLVDMRRLPERPKIIAMSGSGYQGTDDYLTVARRLGANATLEKPFRLSALTEAIERLLASDSAAKQTGQERRPG